MINKSMVKGALFTLVTLALVKKYGPAQVKQYF